MLQLNYRCRTGEVDIVAQEGDYLCFVEVKYRTNQRAGTPEEAVGIYKQRRICRVADYYLLTHPNMAQKQVRFDVVAILGETITLYQNAFPYIG